MWRGSVLDKKELKIGDVISFHDWRIGGQLFGIIIDYKDELYHSKLNIWRPKDIYFLQAHGIDNIEVIHSLEGISEYKLRDLQDIIKRAQDKNIAVNTSWF